MRGSGLPPLVALTVYAENDSWVRVSPDGVAPSQWLPKMALAAASDER